MFIESVMPFNLLILCHALFPPSVFPRIRIFSNEKALLIRWLKYWSFSFSISPSSEYSGLISFRIDRFDLAISSLLQHYSSKPSVFQRSAFFMAQLSHPNMTTDKTIALTRRTFVGKVMSLLFNMLSRFVMVFLSRSKCLLISWLKLPSAVVLEPKKESLSLFPLFPHLFVMTWWDQMPWSLFFYVAFEVSSFSLLFHFHQEAL